MARLMTVQQLARENRAYAGSGGVSQNNRECGFRPAFIDTDTGIIYLSCNCEGSPAPFHCLDGLPEELVLERNAQGQVTAAKPSVLAGFERDGRFYSREQAAQYLANQD